MAKLGSPQTTEFSIGTAELRLGVLSLASMLPQSTSVGLIDDATYTITQDNVDLEGGFPLQIVDTSITRQTGAITANMREGSRRNLKIMLGEGVSATNPTDVATTLSNAADIAAGSASFDVTSATGINVGDVLIIYPVGRPEDVSLIEVASIAVNTITAATGQSTVVAYNALTETGTTFNVFVANQVPIGAVTKTNYFSATLIQQKNNTGRPKVVTFWKTATSGSLEVSTNATDYATFALELKVLQPAVSEYGVGQPLEHIANIIPSHPTGMLAFGADQ